jgi:hypothetical protein
MQQMPVQDSAAVQPDRAPTVPSTQITATQADADRASELIASGITTQPVETVIAVLSSHRRRIDQRCGQGVWD